MKTKSAINDLIFQPISTVFYNNCMQKLEEFIAELKQYATLQKNYLLVCLLEKLIIIVSAIILTFALFILGGIGLFYVSCATIVVLSQWIGTAYSIFVIALVYLTSCAFIYFMRKKIIIRPITRFFSNLFLK